MGAGASEAIAGITTCLVRWREGDRDSLEQLTNLVYGELRRLAAVFLRSQRTGHTLQPTALVHELYLQITGVREVDWKCRAQFFSISARMMRNILVDHARRRSAGKRGSGNLISLSGQEFAPSAGADLLLLDAALLRLAVRYPRQAQVVELRFFGGLTADETAEAMSAEGQEVSLRTVERDWKFSRAWLQNELRST